MDDWLMKPPLTEDELVEHIGRDVSGSEIPRWLELAIIPAVFGLIASSQSIMQGVLVFAICWFCAMQAANGTAGYWRGSVYAILSREKNRLEKRKLLLAQVEAQGAIARSETDRLSVIQG